MTGRILVSLVDPDWYGSLSLELVSWEGITSCPGYYKGNSWTERKLSQISSLKSTFVGAIFFTIIISCPTQCVLRNSRGASAEMGVWRILPLTCLAPLHQQICRALFPPAWPHRSMELGFGRAQSGNHESTQLESLSKSHDSGTMQFFLHGPGLSGHLHGPNNSSSIIEDLGHGVPSNHLVALFTAPSFDHNQEIPSSQAGVTRCRNRYYWVTSMPAVNNRSAFFIMSLLLSEVSNMILKICSSLRFGMKILGPQAVLSFSEATKRVFSYFRAQREHWQVLNKRNLQFEMPPFPLKIY